MLTKHYSVNLWICGSSSTPENLMKHLRTRGGTNSPHHHLPQTSKMHKSLVANVPRRDLFPREVFGYTHTKVLLKHFSQSRVGRGKGRFQTDRTCQPKLFYLPQKHSSLVIAQSRGFPPCLNLPFPRSVPRSKLHRNTFTMVLERSSMC